MSWDDWVMQGFERADRQFLDAAALAGHLVPAGSMFAFLAAHRAEVFPDEDYVDLFAPPGLGRPSVPATQMAAVMTLQALHDFSDREAAEAVRFDVRWKVAIGVSLDDKGFDPSTLVYWRNRIAKSARPHRVNDAVKKVIEQTGILKGRRRRAVDSTILADAVATQDTVTQLVSAIRRVGREVPGAAEKIAAVCTGHDYSKPGKPKIDWDDQQAREGLVSALVNDARRRIARKVAEDRVISTVDPQARHTRKSPEARRDGYRAHVAADPETGIITDEKLTGAAGTANSDAAVAVEFVAAGTPTGGGDGHHDDASQLAWYGDSAYGTGDLRAAIATAGHRAVIKPWPLQPAVAGGFTADDFTVHAAARTVTCPAGITRHLTAKNAVIFGAACRDCPLRERCTTAKDGRTLHLHEHDGLLRAARAAWAAGAGLREDYMAHRPHVERAIAQVATWRGRRIKLRYRGEAKNNAWLKRRTAAVNLRGLLSHGLTRQDSTWGLAT